MTEFDRTNRFSIWKNEKKDPDHPEYRETLPEFTGELDIDGVKYFIDAWKRKDGANPKAPPLAGKVKRKDVQARLDPIPSGPTRSNLDDDIPF